MEELPTQATQTPRSSQSPPTIRGPYARRLDEAPLRAKVAVLILASAVFGSLVGMVEAHVGHAVWPLVTGLMLVAGTLILVGQHWLLIPFDRLASRLERLADTGTGVLQRDLPTGREDEVGRIARTVHRLAASARHHDHEAKQLRRTMNRRVEDATRRATRDLRTLAMRDGLTGLGNRRFFDEQLLQLVDATRLSGDELVCILVDLDDFKQVNDTLGHAVGDELLILLAQLIEASVRESDLAARLGGDEFVVLMPGADAERGRHLIDRIRKLFRQQTRIAYPGGPHADVSAGIATLRAEGCGTGQALLQLADHHLYEAKRNGKGRTYIGHRAAAQDRLALRTATGS